MVEWSRDSSVRRNWYSRDRPAGQQQDVVLAVDDLDVGLADTCRPGRGSPGVRLDAEAEGPPAGLVRGQLELHRHDFAVAAEDDLLAALDLARCRARAVAGGVHVAGEQLHRDQLPGQPLGLDVAGDRVAVARIGPHRRRQVVDAHARGLSRRSRGRR